MSNSFRDLQPGGELKNCEFMDMLFKNVSCVSEYAQPESVMTHAKGAMNNSGCIPCSESFKQAVLAELTSSMNVTPSRSCHESETTVSGSTEKTTKDNRNHVNDLVKSSIVSCVAPLAAPHEAYEAEAHVQCTLDFCEMKNNTVCDIGPEPDNVHLGNVSTSSNVNIVHVTRLIHLKSETMNGSGPGIIKTVHFVDSSLEAVGTKGSFTPAISEYRVMSQQTVSPQAFAQLPTKLLAQPPVQSAAQPLTPLSITSAEVSGEPLQRHGLSAGGSKEPVQHHVSSAWGLGEPLQLNVSSAGGSEEPLHHHVSFAGGSEESVQHHVSSAGGSEGLVQPSVPPSTPADPPPAAATPPSDPGSSGPGSSGPASSGTDLSRPVNTMSPAHPRPMHPAPAKQRPMHWPSTKTCKALQPHLHHLHCSLPQRQPPNLPLRSRHCLPRGRHLFCFGLWCCWLLG
ncbi:hypothetical protein ACER0C_027296 [Sarotherodon galilaeus]